MNATRKSALNMSEHTAEDAIVDAAIASGMISDEELAAAEELDGLATSDEEEYSYTPDEENDGDYDSDDGSELFHDVEDEDDEPIEYPIESEDINDSIALQGVENPFMYEAARLNEKLHAINEEAQLMEEE